MQKRITSQPQRDTLPANIGWLDLETVARVEVTSEDAAHPIESALLTIGATGWRAQSPGEQTIRLLFEAPQRLRRIRLLLLFNRGTGDCLVWRQKPWLIGVGD